MLLATYNDWNNGEKNIGSKEMASLLKGKGFEKKPAKIDGVTVNAFIGADVRLMIDEDEWQWAYPYQKTNNYETCRNSI